MSVAETYPRRHSYPTLQRVALKTSRLAEFCGQRELVTQTGHPIEDWPPVIVKELVDNSLDAAEEARIAPQIDIRVSTKTGEISIADNGPGIPPETVRDILDYSYRVSSREAYTSPTRGAQQNALTTLAAMPFALDGKSGTTVIEAREIRHAITFRVDHLRKEPAIDYEPVPLAPCKKGNCVTVFWPDSATLRCNGGPDDEGLPLVADAGSLDDAVWFAAHTERLFRRRLAVHGTELIRRRQVASPDIYLYKSGWVAHKHREKFGDWPPFGPAEPPEPSAEVLAWVRSGAIAYAKAMGARR
jgi:Histidine kinase-, DNA gyrase B-, and HSP90-like ATPase